MCGIAGYINLDGRPLVREIDVPRLTAMGNAIHHRGPDDTRMMLWENVGFIFKRLSIVDIVGGGQPLETNDGSVCAMVNGEIYNHHEIRADLAHRHTLKTHSDCEVIPYLYQERDLELFAPVNGMFAVALLDRRKRRVLLGRDRLGIKPLFYCVADGGRVLVFASELKGLFAHPAVPRVFDWRQALTEKFAGSETQPQECPSGFRGIERVPAASLVDVDLDRGALAIRKYWTLPDRNEPSMPRPASSYVEGYRALLADSVRLRLMSDVGYGLFLSGGLDSSTLAAMAARAGPFPTFSVVSRSTAGSGDAQGGREVAASLGLPNHSVVFDEDHLTITPDDWRRILWHCETPMVTAEQVFKFYLHAFARERYPQLKVMLLGQGADEFAGGYMAMVLGREGDWKSDDWHCVGRRLRAIEAERAVALSDLNDQWLDLFQSGTLSPGFACDAAGRIGTQVTWDLYVGAFRKNLDYHLWHEDRTAAAHAIENRVPFLDHRVVEFLARVPVEHHAELFADKQIIRRAAAGLLSKKFAVRPKGYFFYGNQERHAFRMMYAILSRNSGELIEQAIEGSARTGGPLDADQFRVYAAEVGRDPSCRDVGRLLDLVNMGLLANMADRQFASTPLSGPLPVTDAGFPDWARPIASQAVADPVEPTNAVVVALASGTRVVVIGPESEGRAKPGTYLVTDKGTDDINSSTWAQFLLRVDGSKSLGEIADAGRLNHSTIRKHVRRALELGILEVRTPVSVHPDAPIAAGTTFTS
ncbi:MAG: asparagine synthase (glutamine-hydrolyzing) [Casimicrobiaceae bacterium]